jgi:hypothetical protein
VTRATTVGNGVSVGTSVAGTVGELFLQLAREIASAMTRIGLIWWRVMKRLYYCSHHTSMILDYLPSDGIIAPIFQTLTQGAIYAATDFDARPRFVGYSL